MAMWLCHPEPYFDLPEFGLWHGKLPNFQDNFEAYIDKNFGTGFKRQVFQNTFSFNPILQLCFELVLCLGGGGIQQSSSSGNIWGSTGSAPTSSQTSVPTGLPNSTSMPNAGFVSAGECSQYIGPCLQRVNKCKRSCTR